MKKHSKKLMFAAAIVIMLNFYSCSTYEEGPAFSLRSKTARLTGEWEVDKIDGDNPDGNLYMEFEDDGDFEMTIEYSYYGSTYSYGYDGEWEWEDNKESVEIEVQGDKQEWEITMLTNDELWFEDENNYEYECEKVD